MIGSPQKIRRPPRVRLTYMRDLIIFGIIFPGAAIALRHPWIGVLLWTWISLMNPHRYSPWTYSFDAPIAALVAGATLLGLLFTPRRDFPFKGAAPVILGIFAIWITASWLAGLDPQADYPRWEKVMKIYLMIFVTLALLRTKEQIFAFAWVCAGSLAIVGMKGGLFTALSGGSYRVWGPPDSFIADNNEFALALVMTIPLLRFLQLQMSAKWARYVLMASMVLCALSVLGSHSRGSFLGAVAMGLLLWWRGRRRIAGGLVMGAISLALIAFMPDEWMNRMESIQDYDEDRSALGRINAWWNSWHLAFDYPLGVGFDAARPELFARYAPDPTFVKAAHSIYFQVLGHHGFTGLFIFMALWIATWRAATKVRRAAREHPQARWCGELAAMAQVSILGYAVGGAFLSLAYFDLPYNIMVMVVLARRWVESKAWERELPVITRRWVVPGAGHSVPAHADVGYERVHAR